MGQAALQAVKDMPPWVALIVALVPVLGGGSLGFNHLETMNNRLIEMEKTLDRNSFRMTIYSGRIDGMTTKNREQDSLIKALELALARRFRAPYELPKADDR
ncbi:MAG: hypothetical protein ACR2QF_15975 [Geminicoccaceae bacterium]